jgi:hypothetical protein
MPTVEKALADLKAEIAAHGETPTGKPTVSVGA